MVTSNAGAVASLGYKHEVLTVHSDCPSGL